MTGVPVIVGSGKTDTHFPGGEDPDADTTLAAV
jgi:hypothetical protein